MKNLKEKKEKVPEKWSVFFIIEFPGRSGQPKLESTKSSNQIGTLKPAVQKTVQHFPENLELKVHSKLKKKENSKFSKN